ncbi:MAG: amidase [Pseudomonadales bacterium]|nr:amidase [Pseudomonadales bacterium]
MNTKATGYRLKSVDVPAVWGRTLKSLVTLVESNYTPTLVIQQLLKQGGIDALRNFTPETSPRMMPFHPGVKSPRKQDIEQARETFLSRYGEGLAAPDENHGYPPVTVADYAHAYRTGSTTPAEVAERLIKRLQSQSADINAIINFNEQHIRLQAQESARRLKENATRSPLEGVPVAVKDELDALPYATSVGTQIYGSDHSASDDATVVARLRDAGALIIGKANMQEIGIGVTGANPHFGVCRNPYDTDYHTGGSSSGSAAATASGLCPIAIAADGGGSVRIPAAFCGQVGLKATWARISEHGAAPLCWSLAHIGPIAATVDDTALAYLLMAGPDEQDPWTQSQPPVHLHDYFNDDLHGLKVGVYHPWFQHASEEIVDACQNGLAALKAQGALIKDAHINFLEEQRVAHVVSISTEMMNAVQAAYREDRTRFALDTRLNLGLSRYFTAHDYIQAQRVRQLAMNEFAAAFKDVDVIATPTTGIVAPKINSKALPDGESNITDLSAIMRFVTPANLTGLPAITVPCGYTQSGLPIGLQLMGRAWEEHTLLRLARIVEGQFKRVRPMVYTDLLND